MATKKHTTRKTPVKKHTTKQAAKHTHVTQHHAKKHTPKNQPKTTALIIGGALLLGLAFVM